MTTQVLELIGDGIADRFGPPDVVGDDSPELSVINPTE
jgi:hypothetical protein